jgi:hypothetical protein
MLPMSSKGGGQCAAFPDVCKVPAPPAPFVLMPFPNVAQVASASGTISKVRVVNKDAVVISSEIPRSSGDEAGTLGGVVSGMNMSKVVFKTASAKVHAAGKPVVFQGSTTGQNRDNVPGAQVAPSQFTVLVMM